MRVVRWTGAQPARPTPARLKVIEAAATPMGPADLARAAGVIVLLTVLCVVLALT